MKIFFIVFLHAVFANALFANEKIKLQLKWFHSFQFAGYYMAKEKGYYDELGLDVEIIERDPSKNNIEQVLNGEAHYGVADSAILLYRAQGEPVKIVASIFQHSPLVFIAKRESKIYSPFEMKGKIISYQQGIDDAPLLSLLKSVNINESEYTYKPLDFSSNDFINSKVDIMSAYLSDQPFTMKEKGIEINIINPLNYGIDFYGDNLFTTDSEIENNPRRVKLFKEASIKGWKYALANVDETIDMLKTKYKAQSSIKHLKYEAHITNEMILPDMLELGYTSKERFYSIARIYQRIGKADKAQLDSAVNTLIYNPQEINKWAKYFYITIILLSIVAITSFILFIINRRLKKLVEIKTNSLQQKNQELQDYIMLVDKNIIISSTDLHGNILSASEAFCDISGYTKEEIIGKDHRIVRHPDMTEEIYKELWSSLRSDKKWIGEIKNRAKDGSFYWVKAFISPVFDEMGTKVGYTAIRQDITDKKLIEEISITDGLTGIYNRRHFDELFPKVINGAKRENKLVNFVIMDIDHFKQYNDIYGHQMGDNALMQVAQVIKDTLKRVDDYCFRLGGEEFGVLFQVDTEEQSLEFAEKIRKNIQNLHIEHNGNSVSKYITVSIGLICARASEIKSVDALYKQADDLLYEAKKGGRNRVSK